MLYQALHATEHSLLVSTPYINESILSVLDFMAAKCSVRLLVRPDQGDRIMDLMQARQAKTFEVRLVPDLNAKQIVFDSLLLLTGSANLTQFALRHPAERFSLKVDEATSERALQLFFDYWHEACRERAPPH
ncbi:phospholipase D-like domain-containing protein [Rhizobium sp. BK619]|uniref:phospholipase D-like domain-containing protein n=1 Tax=Rhizobium sp. BK619 TaxID=2586989 RepID=UPI001FEE9266|nr:phospholipase D-like domain-containing protein [Rhizobium sp. BK619]